MKVHELFVVVILMFHVTSAVGREPRCSKFTFEEELLQKMVRLEFEMDQLKKKMEQKILPTLNEFQKSTVAFSAHDLSNPNPANGEVFVFRNVFLNEGSAYDRYTGVFTAPIDGLYQFTVHVCNAGQQAAVFAIVHNGDMQAVSTQYENTASGCGSVSALIRVNEGDTVNVVTNYGSTKMLENVHRRLSFTGFRIS